MSMNEWLAQMYGTNGTTPQETTSPETIKLANAELFAKLAAQTGIDLSRMTPEDIGTLYAEVFPEETKTAEGGFPFPPKKNGEEKKEDKDEKKDKKDDDKDEDEKKAAALAYHAEKRGFAEKVAEADTMGRVMAHAMVQELGRIEQAKTAGDKMSQLGNLGGHAIPKGGDKPTAKKAMSKEAAAFDEIAANHAIKLAADSGYDVNEAHRLVSAVYTLGLKESEKVASVQDADGAIHVRALEFLEAANYPVNWEEIFGKKG